MCRLQSLGPVLGVRMWDSEVTVTPAKGSHCSILLCIVQKRHRLSLSASTLRKLPWTLSRKGSASIERLTTVIINNCHSSFVFSRLTGASTSTRSKYIPLNPHNDPMVDIITIPILQIEKCRTEIKRPCQGHSAGFQTQVFWASEWVLSAYDSSPLGLGRRCLQGREARDFSASFSMVPAYWGSQVRAQSLQKITVRWAPLGIP